MTPEQFVYWLQGFAELRTLPPTAEQWQSIVDHLKTVFVKVTPHTITDTQILPYKPRKPFDELIGPTCNMEPVRYCQNRNSPTE